MIDATTLSLPNLEIVGFLGQGGTATVWKARQLSLDRYVAIKILSRALASDADDLKRFMQEAHVAALLKHPGIVQVYDANYASGVYYYVMELVDGYTMGDWMQRKERLPLDDVITIAESVTIAMQYAWQQHKMVHCDIKPDNIMVDADGTIKITDLGLSHSVAHSKYDQADLSEEIIGTPAYISPEQIYGDKPLDCRADIYSLGATLYHLATGHLLFPQKNNNDILRCHVGEAQAPDLRHFVPEANSRLALLLEKMLAKEPKRRHQQWRSLLEDLHRMRSGQPPKPVLIPPGGSSMRRDV